MLLTILKITDRQSLVSILNAKLKKQKYLQSPNSLSYYNKK